MKKLAVSLLMTLVVAALSSASTLGSSGKAIFEQYKCSKCHSVTSQGIERSGPAAEGKQSPDLSGAGLKHDAAWIQKWLVKEETLNGKKHIKKFSGSDDELKTLAGWLAGLKKK
ncbi:MAG: cytochrome c [Bacteroidota bacterium]|nr:cytochrome c [Bacteroidota bacterium]MDP4232447.1 cytochrome c [Bacteroidota bacterium]MDP4241583.1 cytochrome c [Bacteroidota bacterium]MDP4286327.1 cytochrome c [Bacteroidota bacterium]